MALVIIAKIYADDGDNMLMWVKPGRLNIQIGISIADHRNSPASIENAADSAIILIALIYSVTFIYSIQ
jgi:hypothetical protein